MNDKAAAELLGQNPGNDPKKDGQSIAHMTNPNPIDELDKILAAHRSETWNTGWNNEATAKAKAGIQKLIDRAVTEARIDELEKIRYNYYATKRPSVHSTCRMTLGDINAHISALRQTTKDNLRGGANE